MATSHMVEVINRLFAKLQGIYGHGFTSKFSTGFNAASGQDDGWENAKSVWADELAGFEDHLEALKYALRNTDPVRAPSAREFLALCRQAPRKQSLHGLPHFPTPEDRERSASAAKAASQAVKASDNRERHWARNPRSAMHFEMIRNAAAKDKRFEAAIADMVHDGICSPEGKLLKVYRDGVFEAYRP